MNDLRDLSIWDERYAALETVVRRHGTRRDVLTLRLLSDAYAVAVDLVGRGEPDRASREERCAALAQAGQTPAKGNP